MSHKQIDIKHNQIDGSHVSLCIRPRQVPALLGISEREVRKFKMRGDLRLSRSDLCESVPWSVEGEGCHQMTEKIREA